MITLDHIAVTAPSLQQGAAHLLAQTGLEIPKGGAHPQMATHNLVTTFGNDTYLEVITPNPDETPPSRPRWFDLDKVTQPSLSAWILRTDDIENCIKRAAKTGVDLGHATALRRGDINWRFSLRHDGQIPLAGAAPLIIQWDTPGPHPSNAMTDLGLRLNQITIATPQAEQLHTLLDCLDLQQRPVIIAAETAQISADLTLPDGTQITLT